MTKNSTFAKAEYKVIFENNIITRKTEREARLVFDRKKQEGLNPKAYIDKVKIGSEYVFNIPLQF